MVRLIDQHNVYRIPIWYRIPRCYLTNNEPSKEKLARFDQMSLTHSKFELKIPCDGLQNVISTEQSVSTTFIFK